MQEDKDPAEEEEEEVQEEEESNGGLVEEKQSCDALSPPGHDGQSEGPGGDAAVLETIIIPPLDCSQAELRTRVVKEVRKPGRSE